ncbi:DEAD/DEAH box helicase [Vibrio sp. UCD-FRSSP16_10]|uniref:DEAD/DEAH box helicase family protein n=1 Tax=unclassified Vibrio TaxID=2614977 RepID=UPI0007FE9769|nr:MULTISPECIES: DEAD/DEAH box helicase family protein [unclassified Vibrio]OBT13430.1 DEAD/DEAH box helicase [Vibrio sp. UCD-FRSSP16_10]OBT17940.1 DEAD/DEAH box helicase [Vibrio sp. UCD-FRSSP16_30]
MPYNTLTLKENVLTTGGDNPLLEQLLHAINHSTEIDIAVSFIQSSGLQLLLPAIEEAIERSKNNATDLRIRLLTSDYLGITDPIALRSLMAITSNNTQVKIFEAKETGFHMKSFIFVRTDKEHTFYNGSAFIGSNNISRAALTNAHEWCLRFDHKEPKHSFEAQQFQLIRHEFHKIFDHDNSTTLSDGWIDQYIERRQQSLPLNLVTPVGIEEDEVYAPNCVQIEALEALLTSRAQGNTRGLVVLGTGMGKTWLSAFDAMQINARRVLFVAHREEILTQALNTYTKLWPNRSAGYFNRTEKSADKELLFASVQTLGKERHLQQFARQHFDYIVIDEFHHASANTYLNILNYFEPTFLLGLTATPERTDQTNILSLCNNNLVFERNLVHGINDGILVPFHYYGIWDDTLNYQAIPWRNGKFDPTSLDAEFATTKRAHHIFKHWLKHQQSRTLAFCVSVAHAEYMTQQFNHYFSAQGFKAVAVHSQSKIRRNEALSLLDTGAIQVLFCVDLFNEGTDLPSIDTILMIRPTQSNIIFLQQLGRGLRTSPNKSHVVVLDFLGNHRSFLKRSDLFQLPDSASKNAVLDQDSSSETPINNQQVQENPAQYSSPVTLGKGCHVNIAPQVIEFWQELKKRFKHTAMDEYQLLEAHLGHRPAASEFFHAGYELTKVNKQHGSWFKLVAHFSDDPALTDVIEKYDTFLFKHIQMTSMTKCFKPILLEAFLELDGFNHPPTLAELAHKSWHILKTYPTLFAHELSAKYQDISPSEASWLRYWKINPIKALTNKTKNSPTSAFSIIEERFVANIEISKQDSALLHRLAKELLDYRLAKYIKSHYSEQP